MEIFVGSDHGGMELKRKLGALLKKQGYDIVDLGPYAYDKDDDYPDYAEKVCKEVLARDGLGILICRSGHGMAITANKFPGIYASVCWNEDSAAKAKRDENINVLCLPGDTMTAGEAKRVASSWLETQFDSVERRKRRLDKVRKIERRNFRKV